MEVQLSRLCQSIGLAATWHFGGSDNCAVKLMQRQRQFGSPAPGRPATMTYDDERHSTTTPFATLNMLEATVLGRCMQRHRHQEFIRFLNAIEAAVPAEPIVHVIADN